jgi:hypothetical protein
MLFQIAGANATAVDAVIRVIRKAADIPPERRT